jgi:hypothetical protein
MDNWFIGRSPVRPSTRRRRRTGSRILSHDRPNSAGGILSTSEPFGTTGDDTGRQVVAAASSVRRTSVSQNVRHSSEPGIALQLRIRSTTCRAIVALALLSIGASGGGRLVVRMCAIIYWPSHGTLPASRVSAHGLGGVCAILNRIGGRGRALLAAGAGPVGELKDRPCIAPAPRTCQRAQGSHRAAHAIGERAGGPACGDELRGQSELVFSRYGRPADPAGDPSGVPNRSLACGKARSCRCWKPPRSDERADDREVHGHQGSGW